MEFKEGIYNIYKPAGITTYDLIRKVKKILNKKIKIGHGGTLDPSAEGVVVVAIGRKYTRQLHYILKDANKEYIAEIILGKKSDTDDITGNIIEVEVNTIPDKQQVENVINTFIGEIEQVPPVYSAVKISGERLCDKVRFRKMSYDEALAVLKPKKVKIYKIEILEYNFPKLVIKALCGSGTYIRALARDIGIKLNCGGIVSKLVRTKVGDYSIEDAIKII